MCLLPHVRDARIKKGDASLDPPHERDAYHTLYWPARINKSRSTAQARTRALPPTDSSIFTLLAAAAAVVRRKKRQAPDDSEDCPAEAAGEKRSRFYYETVKEADYGSVLESAHLLFQF